jgi:hypothetical protein
LPKFELRSSEKYLIFILPTVLERALESVNIFLFRLFVSRVLYLRLRFSYISYTQYEADFFGGGEMSHFCDMSFPVLERKYGNRKTQNIKNHYQIVYVQNATGIQNPESRTLIPTLAKFKILLELV